MRQLIPVLIILLSVISSAAAEQNDCEKLAKEYQNEHWGDLIFIQPLKENGAYDLGAYNGHWINKAYNKERGVFYYDSETDNYFNSTLEVLDWYEWIMDKDAVIFNYNQGEVPFGIIWHY